jgi:drug/metabolite transporter (DMT)-like permease
MTRRSAVGVLMLGIVGISLGTLLVRFSETGPVATGVWRLALSLPVLAVLARRQTLARPGLAVTTGAFFAVDLGFYNVAILLTSLANAALLSNLAPALVTVVAVMLGLARGGWATWGALAVALAGAALLTQGATGQSRWAGDACALASAVGYAGYQLAAQRLRRDTPTAVAMLVSGLVGVALLLPTALLLGETVMPATAQGWLVVGAIAVCGQLLGQVLIVHALAHLSPAFSSVALLGQPTVVALAAWPLAGEALNAQQGLGAAILLAGVVWAHRLHGRLVDSERLT